MMECPQCKEITLIQADEETYECVECGYYECHVSGLPSWHDFDPDFGGGDTTERRNRDGND